MRLRAVLVSLCLASGCGRYGFDDLAQDAAGVAVADAAVVAGDDTGTTLSRETWTFGEVPGATVSGVTADTAMCDGGNSATLNWGADVSFEGGDFCTGLLRFDVSALPAGSTVVETSIAVWPLLVPSVAGRVDVHRITEAWEEGVEVGARGEANYDQRMTGVDWTTRGAQPPGSAEATPLHTFNPTVFEAQQIPLSAGLVQEWLDDPTTNHGVGFFGVDYGSSNNQHPHFVSSDSPEAAMRPVLTVTFDHP